MRHIILAAICLGFVVQEFRLTAQVPHILTYQGRVASGGTNFSGTGQFKFALVSGGTTTAAQASGSATVSFGFVVQIAVISGGTGYTAAPVVTISDSSGSGAVAVAQVANGQVIGVIVTDAGSGYSTSPTITIAPPAMNVSYTTYWSHDATSSAGGEPASAVPVSVAQGLFTVGLGDTLIPNMSALPPQVLANPDVRLRIWFNDGVNGFSQLSPDQRLTSTAYAMMADTVRDGAITAAKLAPNSISATQIAPGSISANQLADGSVTSAKLAANVSLGPPRGSVILSTNENDLSLIAAGYARMQGIRVQTEAWRSPNSSTAIEGRRSQSAVWTGTEMLVWGGVSYSGNTLSNGGRYNPSNNTWIALPTNGAPQGMYAHRALWTGSEMIVWGGQSQSYGGIYNLQSNNWRPINSLNAPTPHADAIILWTGSEMIVWNGQQGVGGRFNPLTEQWSPVSTLNAPVGGAVAIWSGAEMIVWTRMERRGGRYSPASNTWMPVATNSSPIYCSSAVWTGDEMVVFGESGPRSFGVYNASSDSWRSMTSSGLAFGWGPSVWTGTRVAALLNGELSRVGLYSRQDDSWITIPSAGVLNESPSDSTLVWTGNELLSYGDEHCSGLVYHISPSSGFFLFQKQ